MPAVIPCVKVQQDWMIRLQGTFNGGASSPRFVRSTTFYGDEPSPPPSPPLLAHVNAPHLIEAFSLDMRGLRLDISSGCGGKPAAGWQMQQLKPHDIDHFI